MEPSVPAVADALMRSELGDLARQRQLGPRDLGMMYQLNKDRPPMPPTPAAELIPARVAELGQALSAARDPKVRATLQAEVDRLRGIAKQLGDIGQVYHQPPPAFRWDALFDRDVEPPEVLKGGMDPLQEPLRRRM